MIQQSRLRSQTKSKLQLFFLFWVHLFIYVCMYELFSLKDGQDYDSE